MSFSALTSITSSLVMFVANPMCVLQLAFPALTTISGDVGVYVSYFVFCRTLSILITAGSGRIYGDVLCAHAFARRVSGVQRFPLRILAGPDRIHR